GGDGDDTLQGLGGNDQLNGQAGNDSLLGGDGGDGINGGSGFDTVWAGTGNDIVSGGTENDSLSGESGADSLSGDAGNDTLDGGGENDTLSGGDDNDVIIGGGGNDSLYGEAGNDSMEGGDGADYLYNDSQGFNTASGGAGNDTIYSGGIIDGGLDDDRLYYYTIYLNGAYVPATVMGGAGNDFISDWFGYHGTLLDGGIGNDTIYSSSYNESILGGDGDDLLQGSGGTDTLDGGNGVDVAYYGGNLANYVITTNSVTGSVTIQDSRSSSSDGTDLITNVEILSFADDDLVIGNIRGELIVGTISPDHLSGNEASDTIRGLAGNDTLYGQGAPDTIEGGLGNDALYGGRGNDSLTGEGGADLINGESGNDTLDGGGENDTLSGGDGNDVIIGGGGNDSLYGEAGNDSMEGGDGADFLYYDSKGFNTASGGAGNDTIYSGGIIDGGLDDDKLYYYTIYPNGAYVPATVMGGAGNDFISQWASYTHGSLLDGGIGNDTIYGSSYNESILGGDGDDLLHGSGGTDTLDGGDGGNIALYSGSRSQYSVVGDAAGLTIYDNRSGSPDGVDIVRNIGVLRFSDQDVSVAAGLTGVLLEGTSGDDAALIGTILNDTIRGFAGNDVLIGLAGNDLLEGDDGNDTLQGGSGNDTLKGGTGLNRAQFSGNRADYSITTTGSNTNGTTTVVDLQPSLNGNDGNDVLTGVRLLQFLDQLYAINTPPIAVADNATTTEDTVISISLANLLANDSDMDGDSISITGISSISNGFATISAGQLIFTPPTDFHGVSEVTYTLFDGFSSSNGTLLISVSSRNDAPSGADNTISGQEDATLTFNAAQFGFSDPKDGSGPSGSNSLFSVVLSALPSGGTIRLAGATVTTGQEVLASNLADLTYTPAAQANGLLPAILYFQVRDDGGATDGGVDLDPSPNRLRFALNPVNDAPAGSDDIITLLENTPYTFSAGSFGFTDPIDAPSASGANALASVILTTLPAKGQLLLGGVAAVAGQEINLASLGSLTYTPESNSVGNGYATFTFQVRDNGGTSLGGVDLDPTANTLTINVAPINQAPSGSDKFLPVLPGTVHSFSAEDFGFSDPLDAARPTGPHALHSVILTSLPAVGTLRLGSTPVETGQAIAANALFSLTYTPPTNPAGLATVSFTFQVRDNGGTAGGGVDLDPTPNVVTIPLIPTPTVTPLITNDNTPLISGTAAIAATQTFRVSVNGRTYTLGGSPELQLTGSNWTLAIPSAYSLSDQLYNVTATVVDPNGTSASDTTTGELRIDTIAPLTTVSSGPSSLYFPILSGRGEAGAQLRISCAGAEWTLTVPADGNWRLDTATAPASGGFAPNRDGTNPLSITSTDGAGNSSLLNSQLSIRYPYPDLRVSDATLTAGAALDSVSLTYTGLNALPAGPLLAAHGATGGWVDRFYLSPDAIYGNGNDLAIGPAMEGASGRGLAITGPLAAGSSYSRTLSVELPEYPGSYYLIAVTDADRSLAEGTSEGNNVYISAAPIQVTPIYTATVSTATTNLNAGQSLSLSGQLVHGVSGAGVAGKPVTVVFSNQTTGQRFERRITSGTDGTFSLTLTPTTEQAGAYSVAARYSQNPGEDLLPNGSLIAEDTFRVQGLAVGSGTTIRASVAEGATYSGTLSFRNTGPDPLLTSEISVSGAPAGWTFNLASLPSTLAAGATASVAYSLTAPNASVLFDDFDVIATAAASGQAALTARQPFAVTILPNRPVLSVGLAQRSAAMLLGQRTFHEVTLSNTGNASTGPLNVVLPTGAPWLSLYGDTTLAPLAPGASTNILLALDPPASLPLAVQQVSIGFLDESHPSDSLVVPFSFRAVSTATGTVSVAVYDEFSGAPTYPTVNNVSVRLYDRIGDTLLQTLNDADGRFTFAHLPVGEYAIEVRADGHASGWQSFSVDPGDEERVDVFLPSDVVRYSWVVVPTAVRDRYVITLEATFETEVPLPVVTITPAPIDLRDLDLIGQNLVVPLTLTNHGLVAARDLSFQAPVDPNFSFTILGPLTGETIPAESSLVVDLRIERVAQHPNSCVGVELGNLFWDYGTFLPSQVAPITVEKVTPLPFLIDTDCPLPVLPIGGGGGGGG
ncbi:MAG: tandem-95 repeat protein, partial [Cyanobacteriota bacterium]